MAYVSGTANDLAALRTALINACTANGWTLGGNVLSKGTCFAEIVVSGSYLAVRGGTGRDGANALTTPGPQSPRIGPVASLGFAFPMGYEIFIHANPDEVYLVVNYNVDLYQHLAFGASPVPGLPGTGGWYSATCGAATSDSSMFNFADWGTSPVWGAADGGIFYFEWRRAGEHVPAANSSFVHHGLDNKTWAAQDTFGNHSSAVWWGASQGLTKQPLQLLPNAWNSEVVLLPIQVCVERPLNHLSLVASLAHSRFTRIDNYTGGQVLTIGPDRWKTFPFFRKNTAQRDGGGYVPHSGTHGFAVRYDGP